MANHDVKSVDVSAVVIANDLLSGRSVYLTEAGDWTERVENAWQLPDDQSAERAMKYAKTAEDENQIIGAYLVATDTTGRAVHIREQLRVNGPSVQFAPHHELINSTTTQPLSDAHKSLVDELV